MEPDRRTGKYWDQAWYLVHGCTEVSAECDHCWARQAARMRAKHPHPAVRARHEGLVSADGRWTGEVCVQPDQLDKPLRRRKPTVYSVWNDLFHEQVPFQFIADAMQCMADCPRHTFLVLTKRPDRMARFFAEWWRPDVDEPFKRGGRTHQRPRLFLRRAGCSECRYRFLGCLRGRTTWKDKSDRPRYRKTGHEDYFGRPDGICDGFEWNVSGRNHGVAVIMDNGEIAVRDDCCHGGFPGPLKNVWLGTTAGTQAALDERLPHLLRCPAAVRFVSMEPLLGHVELVRVALDEITDSRFNALTGRHNWNGRFIGNLDWVICGAETGRGGRWMGPGWAESLRDQCQAAGVPFWFKRDSYGGRLLDGREWNEMPR